MKITEEVVFNELKDQGIIDKGLAGKLTKDFLDELVKHYSNNPKIEEMYFYTLGVKDFVKSTITRIVPLIVKNLKTNNPVTKECSTTVFKTAIENSLRNTGSSLFEHMPKFFQKEIYGELFDSLFSPNKWSSIPTTLLARIDIAGGVDELCGFMITTMIKKTLASEPSRQYSPYHNLTKNILIKMAATTIKHQLSPSLRQFTNDTIDWVKRNYPILGWGSNQTEPAIA